VRCITSDWPCATKGARSWADRPDWAALYQARRKRDLTREYPKIDILSNLKEDGNYIGSPDAGQDRHTFE
jgi:hypothetical protein